MTDVDRKGKTAKDKKTGAWSNRFDNRKMRDNWGNDSKSTNNTFPREACNGKKNRYRYTGKEGKTVFTGDKK